MKDIADERRKIIDGTYPSRVIMGRQNKHIERTREFEQNREQKVRAACIFIQARLIIRARI
ncbi:MAG: hypothetical protein FWD71_11020 [Oscillospiraceae bacterium]|nr:hypothetical protein [Oscillospiraceae bacterium]